MGSAKQRAVARGKGYTPSADVYAYACRDNRILLWFKRSEVGLMTIDETSKTLGMLLGSVDSIRNQTKDQWSSLEQLEGEVGNNKLALKGVLDAVADLEEQVAKLAPIVVDLKEAKIKAYFFLALIGASGAGLTLAGDWIGQIIGLWS